MREIHLIVAMLANHELYSTVPLLKIHGVIGLLNAVNC